MYIAPKFNNTGCHMVIFHPSVTWQDLEFVELFAGAGEVSSHLRKDCFSFR